MTIIPTALLMFLVFVTYNTLVDNPRIVTKTKEAYALEINQKALEEQLVVERTRRLLATKLSRDMATRVLDLEQQQEDARAKLESEIANNKDPNGSVVTQHDLDRLHGIN